MSNKEKHCLNDPPDYRPSNCESCKDNSCPSKSHSAPLFTSMQSAEELLEKAFDAGMQFGKWFAVHTGPQHIPASPVPMSSNEWIEAHKSEIEPAFTKPPRIYDYRDVDLDEVQALIGKQVYASDNLSVVADDAAEIYVLDHVAGKHWPFHITPMDAVQFIRPVDHHKRLEEQTT